MPIRYICAAEDCNAPAHGQRAVCVKHLVYEFCVLAFACALILGGVALAVAGLRSR